MQHSVILKTEYLEEWLRSRQRVIVQVVKQKMNIRRYIGRFLNQYYAQIQAYIVFCCKLFNFNKSGSLEMAIKLQNQSLEKWSQLSLRFRQFSQPIKSYLSEKDEELHYFMETVFLFITKDLKNFESIKKCLNKQISPSYSQPIQRQYQRLKINTDQQSKKRTDLSTRIKNDLRREMEEDLGAKNGVKQRTRFNSYYQIYKNQKKSPNKNYITKEKTIQQRVRYLSNYNSYKLEKGKNIFEKIKIHQNIQSNTKDQYYIIDRRKGITDRSNNIRTEVNQFPDDSLQIQKEAQFKEGISKRHLDQSNVLELDKQMYNPESNGKNSQKTLEQLLLLQSNVHSSKTFDQNIQSYSDSLELTAQFIPLVESLEITDIYNKDNQKRKKENIQKDLDFSFS